MTKKPRRKLDANDDLASQFVYGASLTLPELEQTVEPETEPGQPVEMESELIENQPAQTPKKAKSTKPKTQNPKSTLMQRLMPTTEKEPTIRLTVDMPESMHRKLSILCARTGRKKADIVRMLLDEALQEVED